MSYRLICDSCTDPTPDLRRDPHFTMVPLSIHVGAETMPDDGELRQAVLLEKMRAAPGGTKTSCPAPAAYLQHFCDGDNYVVTLSGRLSGSYNAAMQACAIYREEGGRGQVHVFNSRSATAGQTQAALLIRELAGAGTPFREVVDQVEAYLERMQTLFVLETLDNLRKNGRLTRMQSLVTGALRVKLLMGATPEGEIEKLGQGLSIRQTLGKMVSHIAADPGHVRKRLVLAHCNCQERVEHVRELVEQKCGFSEIVIVPTGGIATVYANNGGVVAAY